MRRSDNLAVQPNWKLAFLAVADSKSDLSRFGMAGCYIEGPPSLPPKSEPMVNRDNLCIHTYYIYINTHVYIFMFLSIFLLSKI